MIRNHRAVLGGARRCSAVLGGARRCSPHESGLKVLILVKDAGPGVQ